MTTFQKHLEVAMTASGMTAAELSRKTGISEATIANYRAGRYSPRQSKIYELAKALNVSPGWLIGFDVPDKEEELDKAILHLLSQLTVEQRKQALDYIRFLAANRKD